VGHSNLEFAQFIKLLIDSSIQLLMDVRSRPQSGRFPQFSQPAFEKLLEGEGIPYLFLGEELGGRPDDPDYAFGAGLERVLGELASRSLALMCAEEDPLECHRFLMICPELVASGIQPLHIRRGSQIETQEATETRLLESSGFADVAANTLFPAARAEALEKAYDLQAAKFAFRVDPLAVDRW
jgi:uncharacterized protein (DUF488 family)